MPIATNVLDRETTELGEHSATVPVNTETGLPTVSWTEDYERRANPALFTDLLGEAVPVLRWAQWRVLDTAEGFARALLPLTDRTTNQQGTHQGALMMLAAEYAGGVALATLFPGFPIVGVHAQESDWPADRAAMWLAKAEMTYATPSTADLIVTCRVPTEQIERIRHRFLQGAPIVLPLVVELESDGTRVATATLTYFARRSSFLKPQTPADRPSRLFVHMIKASARLVAGLRAHNSSSPTPLFHDPYSASVAGTHGRLLADQFSRVLPELPMLVAARTRDADDCLTAALACGARQVVFIGVGFDCRPLRLLADDHNVSIFELDLTVMLDERERLLASLPQTAPLHRTQVPIDLSQDDLAVELLRARDFDPELPTVFVFEGVSMYLAKADNQRVLRSIARLMKHPQSRLWLDSIASSVVDDTTGHATVTQFVRRMARIGEPFVFGLDCPESFFRSVGLEPVRTTAASAYHSAERSPILDLYRFHVVRRSSTDIGQL